MVKGLAYIMYPASDMPRARRFYEHDLGLQATRTFQDAWVEYDLMGGTFALSTAAQGCEPCSTAAAMALEVDDVDQVTEDLRSKGRAVKVEPFSTPVCRMSVVLDTEGNALTLHQATRQW